MRLYATSNGHQYELDVTADGPRLRVGGHDVALDDQESSIRTAFVDDRRIEFGWAHRDGVYTIMIDGIDYRVEVRDALSQRAAELAGARGAPAAEVAVAAPIPGLVRAVLVQEGQRVAKDQPLLTLDAMKLENELPAPREGIVRSVKVRPGTAVEKGQVLLVIG